jgi:hypothetical protein
MWSQMRGMMFWSSIILSLIAGSAASNLRLENRVRVSMLHPQNTTYAYGPIQKWLFALEAPRIFWENSSRFALTFSYILRSETSTYGFNSNILPASEYFDWPEPTTPEGPWFSQMTFHYPLNDTKYWIPAGQYEMSWYLGVQPDDENVYKTCNVTRPGGLAGGAVWFTVADKGRDMDVMLPFVTDNDGCLDYPGQATVINDLKLAEKDQTGCASFEFADFDKCADKGSLSLDEANKLITHPNFPSKAFPGDKTGPGASTGTRSASPSSTSKSAAAVVARNSGTFLKLLGLITTYLVL